MIVRHAIDWTTNGYVARLIPDDNESFCMNLESLKERIKNFTRNRFYCEVEKLALKDLQVALTGAGR